MNGDQRPCVGAAWPDATRKPCRNNKSNAAIDHHFLCYYTKSNYKGLDFRDVLEMFRASGPGWQTRMNAALRDWLKTHSPTRIS
ncbi:MAG: BrnA antitoxin family protein [Acidithiobacillus sp.]